MRLLRLVGPDEDGTSLIVEAVEPGSLEGERFALSLDDRLRSMASTPSEPQSEQEPMTTSESAGPVPTPREIQVRVRAGETAQAVADEAGIPLERVMRFAYPVLQERVRVTDEARRARARRGGDGLLTPFGELIDSRLARHGVDPASVRWDAYRREDGGWTVTSDFSSHERPVQAKFSFALLNRTVSALDDVAADLLSDRPAQALLPAPVASPAAEPAGAEGAPDWDAAAPPPRLTAVPSPRVDVPRPQEAGAAVRPPSRRQKAHTRPVPVHVEDELFDQDAFDQQPIEQQQPFDQQPFDQQPWHEPQLPFESGSAPSSASPRHRVRRPAGDPQGGAHSEPAQPARPEPAEALVTETVITETVVVETVVVEPAPARPEASADLDAPADDDTDLVGARAGAGEPQHKRGRRAGEKPRMPSWDDILLGVRHKSD